jgi:hypothetical protein
MVPASWRAGAPFHGAPISVASAAIATGKIAVNAVSQLLNTGIGGTVALSNVFQTLQSRVVTTAGGAVMVNAKAFTDFDSTAAARTITLRIRNTSTGLFSGTARWDVQAGLAHNGISHSLFFQEQPAAGTYTYVIEAALDATANITNPNGRSGYIQLAEMKR